MNTQNDNVSRTQGSVTPTSYNQMIEPHQPVSNYAHGAMVTNLPRNLNTGNHARETPMEFNQALTCSPEQPEDHGTETSLVSPKEKCSFTPNDARNANIERNRHQTEDDKNTFEQKIQLVSNNNFT